MKEWLRLFLNAIIIVFGFLVITLLFVSLGLRISIDINVVSIVFAALAFASLREALRASNARRALGGLHGFVWLLAIAAIGVFGSANVFITLGIIASIFLGTFSRPIAAFLLNRKAPHITFSDMQQSAPYYQPSQQAPEQAERGYEQGYLAAENREEGNAQSVPSLEGQYEQPQTQYPQQMPPQ